MSLCQRVKRKNFTLLRDLQTEASWWCLSIYMILKRKYSPKNLQKPWSDRWEHLPLLRLKHPKKNEHFGSSLFTPLSSPTLSEIKILRVGEKSQNHLTYTVVYIYSSSLYCSIQIQPWLVTKRFI